MLTATELECVRGNRTVFQKLTFSVVPGECLQLTGPNGSGKTSLIRILCGLMEPSRGTVSWKGLDIRHVAEDYRTCITYLGHKPGIKEELTPLENLQITCGLNGREISRSRAICALEYMGLTDRESGLSRFLSEGQRRRIALARLVFNTSEIWLLDEVMTALDRNGMESVQALIDGHLSRGGLAIVATHQDLGLSQGQLQRIELAA